MRKKPKSEEPRQAYLVLKMCENIEWPDPLHPGRMMDTKLNGLDGFAPIFYDRAEAEKESMDGKYQILIVEAVSRK